jgi:hypothetical protein
MKTVGSIAFLAGLVLAVVPARGQDAGSDRLVVNFSDPSRPGLLKVSLVNGGVSVRSHTGKEIIIESRSFGRNRRPSTTRDGLRRIDANMTGFSIEEENNVMTVSSQGNDAGNLSIQVPARTNLSLRTVNGGNIVIEDVEGEIEVSNTNGSVLLNNVAGSVVAHATNGRIVASLRDITPDKPMSFSSMNANVDVTLPSTAKANLKMRTDNGETYTDFDIQLRPGSLSAAEDTRNRGGRFRIVTERTINGTINGGGPDLDLRTLNGNIYIRKGK